MLDLPKGRGIWDKMKKHFVQGGGIWGHLRTSLVYIEIEIR